MSAMDDMLVGMMKKLIPPEVVDMLTKEKVQEMGDKVNTFLISVNHNFEIIKAEQAAQRVLIVSIMEGQGNGGHYDSGSGRGTLFAGGPAAISGTGDG